MAKNFKLTIEYDGARYQGWQRQPNGPSIQMQIESAVETMTQQKITLIGSGRTDAGVHAQGQVANFLCDTRLEPPELIKGLNSILPGDIVIRNCEQVSPQFHARFDARSKIYRYTIINQPLRPAIGRQYGWWLRSPLDLAAMQSATDHLLGEHDFKAFEGAGSPRAHSRRQVQRAQWTLPQRHRIFFEIQANGFLRYMVRNIVGTLVAVGQEKLSVTQFQEILASRDRNRAAATAPANGLVLVRVNYT